jgi:hypothetical protein
MLPQPDYTSRLIQPPLQHHILAGRDLSPGLVQLGFHFVSQLKMILEVIINPLADFLDFLSRQFWNRRLNFFDRAHS